MLGHNKVETTARYAHLGNDALKAVANRIATRIADIAGQLPAPALSIRIRRCRQARQGICGAVAGPPHPGKRFGGAAFADYRVVRTRAPSYTASSISRKGAKSSAESQICLKQISMVHYQAELPDNQWLCENTEGPCHCQIKFLKVITKNYWKSVKH